MANARITSIALDVLRQGDGKARVTSIAVDVLRNAQSKARVTSFAVDILSPDLPSTEHSVTGVSVQVAHDQVGDVDMTFTQEGVEALTGGDSSFEATTEGVEALVGGDAPFEVTAEGVEVLWTPLVFTGCESASVFYRVRLVLPGDTADLVVFTSLPSGDNSVILGEPKIDASTIDVLKGTSTVGGATITIGDPEAGSCTTPDLTDRILTKILADANADFQLLGARMYIEATDNPAPIEIDWLPYWAGYVTAVRFTSAIEVEISGAHTTRDDETTMVWKNSTPNFSTTGNVMGGPTLVNWPSDKESERLTYFQGAWVMKVTVVQPTYVEFDIDEDASANYVGSGAGLSFPPADIRPYIKDRGLFQVSNNDTQKNVFRWAQRNVQPYFSEGGPDEVTRTAWEVATTEGWFPRLRCVIRTKNGMFVNQEFPVMASNASNITDLNGSVIKRERSEIYQDLGNKFRIYWPATDPTPQPAVNDVVTFNVRALDISEANPLLISQHPVDILTNLWDELDIEYDASSAAVAKAALGEFVAALRITEPTSLKDAQTMICAGFGIGWRHAPDGLRYLFTTRVRPTVQGTITIEDLVGSNGVVWESDEQSRLFSASYEWKRFKVWPGDEDGKTVDRALDGVMPYDVGPITFQTDDIGDKPYGSRDEQYRIPGSVYSLKDGEVAAQWSIADHVDITANLTAPLLEQFGRGGIMTTIDLNHCVDVQEGEDWLLELVHRPGFDSTYSPVSQRGLVERVQCISRTPHGWGTTVTFIRVPQDSVSVVPIVVDAGTAEPLTITFEVLDATATGGNSIDQTDVGETFSAFAFYAKFVLSANSTIYYDDLDVVVDVDYSETFAAPADDSVFRLRLAPWDGVFPVEIGTFDPDALVWYRTRVRFGTYVGTWSAWSSIQLTNTVGSSTPTPTVSLVPDGSWNVNAQIVASPETVRIYTKASTTTFPTAAATLLETPVAGATASISAIIATLAAGSTAYVTSVAEDLFGNRSIIGTSSFTRPSAGGNSFGKIVVAGQSDVDADSATDTLTLQAGSNITLTTDPATDKVTIASTASGGGVYAGAMREIASVTTTGSQTSVTFSAIPGTYRDLMVIVHARGTAALSGVESYIRFNGDTAANYFWLLENRFGTGSSGSTGYLRTGSISGASASSSTASSQRIMLPSYNNSIFRKHMLSENGLIDGAGLSNVLVMHTDGWWSGLTPITQIELFLSSGAFVDGSQVTLYGIGGEVGGASLNPIYTKYDPFCPPASPSSLNDEFTVDVTGTPTGWTAQGGAPVSSAVKNGKWVVTPILSGSRNMAAIEKVLPSGPFTIVTHAVNEGYDLFHHVDLFIRSSVSGRIYCNRMYCGPSSNNRLMDLVAVNMTSFTADNAALAFRNVFTNYGFFRIVYDGTTLYFDFSDDGSAWRRIGTTAITSWFTGGNLPDRFGVACASVNGSLNMEASFEFVRYFPTAFADFGRNIGVGSDGTFVDPLALLLHNKVI